MRRKKNTENIIMENQESSNTGVKSLNTAKDLDMEKLLERLDTESQTDNIQNSNIYKVQLMRNRFFKLLVLNILKYLQKIFFVKN